tara:strand:+ start:209 stop:805 length:597 start_codon:yes stop_codon:yes gene_type:complete
MEVEHWFPTTMWNTKLDNIDNQKLEQFSIKMMNKDEKGVIKSNRGGWQSDGILRGSNEEFDKLAGVILDKVNEASSEVGLGEMQLSNIWINVNGKGGYNTLHTHLRSAFSGVYYVKAGPGQGGFHFERNDGAEHHLPNTTSLDNCNTFNVYSWIHSSESSKLIIFPSWLRHSVQQNETDEYRISISFNCDSADGERLC